MHYSCGEVNLLRRFHRSYCSYGHEEVPGALSVYLVVTTVLFTYIGGALKLGEESVSH